MRDLSPFFDGASKGRAITKTLAWQMEMARNALGRFGRAILDGLHIPAPRSDWQTLWYLLIAFCLFRTAVDVLTWVLDQINPAGAH